MKLKKTAVFPIAAALTLACLLALVWVFVLRERSSRRLYLEYEVFRTLTSLTDLVRDPNAVFPQDERLLGFALYRADGTRTFNYGSTPERLSAHELQDPASARRMTETSFILVRLFGMDAMRRPLPAGRPDRPGMGMRMTMGNVAHYAYIEYGLGSFIRSQRIILFGALALSAALTGAYLLMVHLYRKNLELQEREYQSRELVQLGEAARTLAHEIKNPLGIIKVQSALLKRTVGRGAEDGFRIIDEEVIRLGNLVDRIREFLKSGQGKPEEIEVSTFLAEWALRHGESVRLESQVGPGGSIRFDRERLSIILDNLTRNALESLEDNSNDRIVDIRAGSRRGSLFVRVCDRGVGVPSSEVHRLFEPFYTTKESGTGIGLALCRKWALAGGGTLEYRPRDGGGSVFEFTIGLAGATANP